MIIAAMTTKPVKPSTKAKARPKKAKPGARPKKTVKVGEAEVRITAKQQRFAEEYLVDSNATQAAIRAGYSKGTAQQMGSENLSKPVIRAAIEEAREKLQQTSGVTAERATKEAARLAFFDPRKLFMPDGSPVPIHMLDDDTAACIGGIDVVSIGNAEHGIGQVLKYKIWDKNSAIEKIYKQLGLYEEDNRQKTDPLKALLDKIATSNKSAFKPVAADPEHEDE